MVREIKESDWKLFRRLHAVALERFCRQVIEEINHTTSNCTRDYHKRYLEVFSLIRKRDEELGRHLTTCADQMHSSLEAILEIRGT
jgi:hypothetical protein